MLPFLLVSIISTLLTDFKGIHLFIYFSLNKHLTRGRAGPCPGSQRIQVFFTNGRIQFNNHLPGEQLLICVHCGSGTAGEGLQLLKNLQPCYCKYDNKRTRYSDLL